jgi:S1-C subfamily serine protease
MKINIDKSLFKKGLWAIATVASVQLCYDATASDDVKKKKFTHFTSGTGFFISPHQIVTNEHVVKDCKYIKVRGAVKPDHATVVFKDTLNDLALLKTSASSGRVAQLRGENIPLQVGEAVTVMGYPLEHGINGEYMVKKGSITDTEDMYQGVKRLQFTDTVEKGNSGGPLLDDNGNVVGVVVGKMSFYLADSNMSGENAKPVKTSSMAISLESLRQFLSENKVAYRSSGVQYSIADKWMESKAKDYIVNVHCIKD